MKRKTLLLLILFALLLAAAVFGYRNLSVRYTPQDVVPQTQAPKKAADFTVYDESGNAVKLSDFKGKKVVINFWATWCGPCKSELPAFDEAYRAAAADTVFLMVNLTDGARDTVDGVKAFKAQEGYTFPIYFDTDYSAANAYSIRSIPMSVFVDADGNITGTHVGAMSAQTLQGYIAK